MSSLAHDGHCSTESRPRTLHGVRKRARRCWRARRVILDLRRAGRIAQRPGRMQIHGAPPPARLCNTCNTQLPDTWRRLRAGAAGCVTHASEIRASDDRQRDWLLWSVIKSEALDSEVFLTRLTRDTLGIFERVWFRFGLPQACHQFSFRKKKVCLRTLKNNFWKKNQQLGPAACSFAWPGLVRPGPRPGPPPLGAWGRPR